MTDVTRELLDALDEGPDRFVEVYSQLEVTPHDLVDFWCALMPMLTMKQRCERIEAGANQVFGHGFFNPH